MRAKALEVYKRLLEVYGQPLRRTMAPLDVLILTILSQNTNDINRDRAFTRLKERFPTWEEVLVAPEGAIQEAIRPAGLANIKAPRIKDALKAVLDYAGSLDLSFICDLPREEARRWLTGIRGVGPKTAAVVLLFACGKEAFPVDTHIHRVTRRLGLVPWKATRERAHDILEAILPPSTFYSFHIDLIEHGRKVCKAGRPLCTLCNLKDLCDYYSSKAASTTATASPAATP